MKKKISGKKKKVFNIVFNIILAIAVIIMLIFSYYVFKLDMLPAKYMTIIFCAIGFIYAIFAFLIIHKRIKIGIKLFCSIILVLFSIVFFIGIKYVDKTIDVLGKVSEGIAQKEYYYVEVLKDSSVSDLKELKNKKIGIYKNNNYDKVIKKITKKLDFEVVDYQNPVDLLEDLDLGEIDAVIINTTIESIVETDLKYLDVNLKRIYEFSISVDEINEAKKIDVTMQPFNIYIAGGDSYGSIDKVTNTDVNMVVTVDAKNHKILLTSIPRDYYVLLPSYNSYDKLTHAGYYGVQESISTVENLLDIDINYYVKVNFSTVEKLVDAIGGVDVYSDYSFTEDSSLKRYRYVKGNNHLNGAQALAFARERHAFSDGDIQRGKNQQKVIEAILNKITGSTTLLKNYTRILDSLGESLATNIDSKSINRLMKMQLNDMSGWKIESQNLVGTNGTSTNCYSIPKLSLYIMNPDKNSVSEASQKIKEFMKVE